MEQFCAAVTRRRQCDITGGSRWPTPTTNAATTMTKVFNMFFNDQILGVICTFINSEA